MARALNFAALVATARQDLAGARAANDEAVEVARAIGHPVWLALSLGSLGHTLARQGETARALEALNEYLAFLRTVGYERGMGWAHEGLAINLLARGDTARAQAHFREAIALAWKYGSLATVALELPMLAAALAAEGQAERAARLLGAAAALRESIGLTDANEEASGASHEAAQVRAALGDDRFSAAWDAGRAQSLELMIAEALEPAPAPVDPPPLSLTRREAEILGLLVAGQPDREIAEALTLSVRTVEHHVAHILAKLDVRTRTAAVSAAIAAGLAGPGPNIPD